MHNSSDIVVNYCNAKNLFKHKNLEFFTPQVLLHMCWLNCQVLSVKSQQNPPQGLNSPISIHILHKYQPLLQLAHIFSCFKIKENGSLHKISVYCDSWQWFPVIVFLYSKHQRGELQPEEFVAMNIDRAWQKHPSHSFSFISGSNAIHLATVKILTNIKAEKEW